MDDAELVALARRDPGEGWAAIWDRHGDALHGYCLRLLGDRADADDVVADVFLVAAQRLDQLRDPSALRAWLYAISRRAVQQRWRQRGRTVPVDPQGATVMNQVGTHDDAPLGAGDAAELLAAAAAGLPVKDQELLALTLGADLDTTEVARITGESTNAVSVRVTRLKDTVGRAAGALLVARQHRRECDDLDAILASWDGTFDTVWRKRIARHIDDCDVCEDRRRAATAVFAAPLLVAPTGDALRQRVLEPISSIRPTPVPGFDLGDLDDDGFPAPEDWPTPASSATKKAVAALAVAAALVLVVVGLVLAGGDDDGAVEAVAAGATSTSTSGSSPSSSTTAPSTTATTAPEVAAPTSAPADAPATSVPAVVDPTPPPPTVTTVPLPAPTVRISLSPTRIGPVGFCGQDRFSTATVVVGPGAGGERTVISWDGPDAGERVLDGTGQRSVRIGPFTQLADDPDGNGESTITVTAVTTAADGQTATASTPLVVYIVGC